MLDHPSASIAFSTAALKANLQRLDDEWETYQNTRDRAAVYGYLTVVFELVTWWAHEQKAIAYASRALRLRGRYSLSRKPEPFAAIILCTADNERVDDKTRSKWSRVLRYAALYKILNEPLSDFIKRKGGLNRCAARYTRRLGRCARTDG